MGQDAKNIQFERARKGDPPPFRMDFPPAASALEVRCVNLALKP
jgi:hypothetical protein